MSRIAHIVSHPIQYFVPIYRHLHQSNQIDLVVCFGSRFGLQPSLDVGIGKEVSFGNNLLDGYESRFLNNSGSGVPNGDATSFVTLNIDRELDEIAPDLLWIHGWGYRMHHQAMRWAKRRNVPYLLRGETTLLDAPRFSLRWWRRVWKYRYAFLGATRLLYVGEQNRRFYMSMAVPESKLAPMFYSIDTDAFQPSQPAFAKSTRQFRVMTLCKLIPRKRVDDIIRAMADLPIDVELHILGDGAQRTELETLARTMKHRIEFHGFVTQSQLPSFFASADLFVLASSEETWGLVVNEAMACGLPCIVSDRCGCAIDLVPSSMKFRCGRSRELASIIHDKYAQNKQEPHVNSNRRKIVDRYSSSASAKQFIEAIASL